MKKEAILVFSLKFYQTIEKRICRKLMEKIFIKRCKEKNIPLLELNTDIDNNLF